MTLPMMRSMLLSKKMSAVVTIVSGASAAESKAVPIAITPFSFAAWTVPMTLSLPVAVMARTMRSTAGTGRCLDRRDQLRARGKIAVRDQLPCRHGIKRRIRDIGGAIGESQPARLRYDVDGVRRRARLRADVEPFDHAQDLQHRERPGARR